jgi:uncharacterized membrane protein SirB2
MNLYLIFKTIHVTTVIMTFLSFIGRGFWMLFSPQQLQRRWVRIAPHVIDTVLLASAIGLTIVLQQYPFVDTWLTAKVLALIGYILCGSIALKHGKTKAVRLGAGCVALALFAYMVAVARSKTPLPWLS